MKGKYSAYFEKAAPTLKLIAPTLLALALTSLPFAHSRKSAISEPVAPTHVTVIDVNSAEAKPDCAVVIVDGRIAEIGPDKREASAIRLAEASLIF